MKIEGFNNPSASVFVNDSEIFRQGGAARCNKNMIFGLRRRMSVQQQEEGEDREFNQNFTLLKVSFLFFAIPWITKLCGGNTLNS